MNRTRETVRQALNFLAEKARVTDDELGQMLGKSRQTGWAKRHGTSRITWDDFDLLVLGFDVDKQVFLMEEADLEKWYARTKWTGPKRPIATIDLRTDVCTCDHPYGSYALRLFDPDELPEVIDLRDHMVTHHHENESPRLYANAS